MDFDQCACSGRSLGKLLRPGIMAALAQGPMHGYRVAQELRRLPLFTAAEPDHAGLYRALKAMEEEGLVTSRWDLADSGPARRQYKLTAAGRRCLAKWMETLGHYRQAIDELLGFCREGRTGPGR